MASSYLLRERRSLEQAWHDGAVGRRRAFQADPVRSFGKALDRLGSAIERSRGLRGATAPPLWSAAALLARDLAASLPRQEAPAWPGLGPEKSATVNHGLP